MRALEQIAGAGNVAVGYAALDACTTASGNIGIGQDALGAATTGYRNVGIGQSAGDAVTTGYNNICIGYNADASGANVNNEIVLGNSIVEKETEPFSLQLIAVFSTAVTLRLGLQHLTAGLKRTSWITARAF